MVLKNNVLDNVQYKFIIVFMNTHACDNLIWGLYEFSAFAPFHEYLDDFCINHLYLAYLWHKI